MKKAVAYARFSSSNQREESIDAQVRAIKEYCQQNNINLINIYTDEAYSATTDDRPAFQRMIKEVEGIDYVIVHKLDRFSRDRYDSAINKKKLRDKGIRVISVLEQFDDSPESAMLEAVIEGMNQYYSMNLSREVKKGFRENALKCKHNGGDPPFGFDVDSELNYIINSVEAKGVQMIFDMYLADMGYADIAKALKDNGFKTKRGNHFKKTAIYEILRNEKYIGTYIYGRRDGNNNHKESKEVIRIEDGMPRIISDEVWEKAKLKRERNRHMAGRYKSKRVNILSGLVYHECGAPMVGSSKPTKSGDRIYYYRCEKGCDIKHKSIQAELLEKQVIESLNEHLFNDSKFNLAEKLYQRYTEGVLKDNDIITLEKEINDLRAEEKRMVDAIVAGFYSDELKERNNEIQKQIKYLESEIEYNSKVNNSYTLEDFKNFLNTFKDIATFEPEEQREIIQMFVHKVFIYEKRIRVLLNNTYPENKKPSQLRDGGMYGRDDTYKYVPPIEYIIERKVA